MTRKPPAPTLAYVRWFDSTMYTTTEMEVGELTGFSEMESAGILVEDTASHVTLALDRSLETGRYRLLLTIPRVNVRKIRKVKV